MLCVQHCCLPPWEGRRSSGPYSSFHCILTIPLTPKSASSTCVKIPAMINNCSAHTTNFFHPNNFFWLTCSCSSKSVTPLILEYFAHKEIVASIKAPATTPMFAIFASRQLLRRDDREKAAAPPGPESESGGWVTENSRFEDHT